MGRIIPFRLREGKDDDIAQALDQASEKEDRSDIIRAALRAYFFGQPARPAPQLRHKSQADVDLVRTEKADAQLDADLDSLLGD